MPLLTELTAALRDLVPARCPRCRELAADGYCSACRADFARIARPCRRCGLASPCRPCPARDPTWRLDGVIAPFAYCDPLAAELQAFKYAKQRSLAVALGRLLADELGRAARGVDALVPVPLHARRLRERTFNQADEIGRKLARETGIPLLFAGIARRRHAKAQAALGRRARLASLAQAFVVSNRALAGRKLAIVDDVITTGATANALAAALRAAGAASVVAFAIARTPDRAAHRPHPARNR